MNKVNVWLYCTDCWQETLHSVAYIGDSILMTECLTCHKRVKMQESVPAVVGMLRNGFRRIRTKPSRFREELQESPGRSIRSLPKRIITKPNRLAHEVSVDIRCLKSLYADEKKAKQS